MAFEVGSFEFRVLTLQTPAALLDPSGGTGGPGGTDGCGCSDHGEFKCDRNERTRISYIGWG